MNIEAQDRAAIIEAVAAEVIKRLGQQEKKEPAAARKQAVLLSMEAIPELESVLNSHVDVRYYDETLRDCDVLIIPQLCIQLLANLANGISAGPRERFVLTMLLKGREVIALEEGLQYRKYKSMAPVLLYKMYDEFTAKLSAYGIRLVKEQDLPAACLENGNVSGKLQVGQKPVAAQEDNQVESVVSDIASHALVLNRKVITEAELKKHRLHNGNEIVIDRHSIITPLAQDYLRMQKMQVHRR
ncbi:ethanolamine utilization protein [Paenibacillus popilliae]|uniref:Ethanolamine utilization protein n=1 Tax=Paenibacillus popilliae TaxID=78057 RepID=A0ABY3AUM0_PAEPP|nr:ethanolamine utilization protein [Paenibacillus sp. SDF0028]TQR44293.1 ethanolamine utilization protein [Paenibacillus sp. SDF0028]